ATVHWPRTTGHWPLPPATANTVRRVADVYVRASGRAGDGLTEGDEGDALTAKVMHQRLAFGAVGVDGYVYRVAVIEAELRVHSRLPERADGQGAMKLAEEITLNFCRVRKRPVRRPVIADQHAARDGRADARRRQQGELRFGFGFGDEAVGFGHLAARFSDLRLRGGKPALALFKIAL